MNGIGIFAPPRRGGEGPTKWEGANEVHSLSDYIQQ